MEDTAETCRDINILDFVEARSQEMDAVSKLSARLQGSLRAYQGLPRHMRRRAAAHDVRRVPRRLREASQKSMVKCNTPKIGRRPSRRYRRRPSCLQSEYARRQRAHVWLETHIWHAKRFRMTSQWGYKIPLRPNDKGERSCYRAVQNHCLLMDLSYYCCLELSGPRNDILKLLAPLCEPKTGPTFASKATAAGCRVGYTVLYTPETYPAGAIGPVSYLWRAHGHDVTPAGADVTPPSSDVTQLWMWCHPAIYTPLWQQICALMDCQAGDVTAAQNPEVTQGAVTFRSLKDKLCRFRLYGPTSHSVLQETLQPADVSIGNDDVTMGTDDVRPWWQSLYSDDVTRQGHRAQSARWRGLGSVTSPSDLPSHCVTSLTVRDPRISIPQKRTPPALPSITDERPLSRIAAPTAIECESPLWDTKTRQQMTSQMMTQQALNQRRAELLVPGSPLQLDAEESRVAVLVLQRPGRRVTSRRGEALSARRSGTVDRLAQGCGYDVILPSGWARALWVALVYRGARAAGLADLQAVTMETGAPHFPRDYPDTAACRVHMATVRGELEAAHNRRPKSKRPNYRVLGVESPFHCPWAELTQAWSAHRGLQQGAEHHVVRERGQLTALARLMTSHPGSGDAAPAAKRRCLPAVDLDVGGALVAVVVTSEGRGSAAAYSAICLPTSRDLLDHAAGKPPPSEPEHGDPQRDTAKDEQVKVKSKDDVFKVTDARAHCSRVTLGYVTCGRFLYGRGGGAGRGFVVLCALREVRAGRRGGAPLVLLRSPRSLQYRWAYLTLQDCDLST